MHRPLKSFTHPFVHVEHHKTTVILMESILEEWEWDSPISFFGKRVSFLIPSTMGLTEEMGLGRMPPIT
jgi:hypothetical protein